MTGQVLRHRVKVAGLQAASLQESVLEVRGLDDQRVPLPLGSRETRPAMRSITGRMRSVIQVNRPVEGTPVLKMVPRHIASQRVQLFQDARAAYATPRVRR